MHERQPRLKNAFARTCEIAHRWCVCARVRKRRNLPLVPLSFSERFAFVRTTAAAQREITHRHSHLQFFLQRVRNIRTKERASHIRIFIPQEMWFQVGENCNFANFTRNKGSENARNENLGTGSLLPTSCTAIKLSFSTAAAAPLSHSHSLSFSLWVMTRINAFWDGKRQQLR